jgi:virginiamycin A acetyltransferase
MEGHLPRVTFSCGRWHEGRANVEVGAYSYYDDPDEPEKFFERNVLHHFDFVGDRLTIGPFLRLRHRRPDHHERREPRDGGFSTFPFNIFGGGWETGFDPSTWASRHAR